MSDREEVLELYKAFVDTITANEQRRQTLSAFYTSLIAAAGALLASDHQYEPIWIAVVVLIVSTIWFLSVRYFRRLASAKFAVIRQMEAHFSIRPFELEWHHFKHKTAETKKGGEEGNLEVDEAKPEQRKWARWTLTHYDQVIPLLAVVASGVYLFLQIYDAVLECLSK